MGNARRVVITGMGLVTPIGFDETEFWDRLMAGHTGIRRVRNLDVSGHRCTVAAEIENDVLSVALQSEGIRPVDRAVDMAVLAAGRALRQAGVVDGPCLPPPRPAATLFGTGFGSAPSLFEAYQGFAAKGVRGIRPTAVPRCMANACCSQISLRYRLTGPNYAVVSACSSSTTAIGLAFRMVRDGYADQALCGGTEAPVDPAVFAAWDNLGVLSRNPDPLRACRPFDAARDGCVLGEGAGALFVETLDSAETRGAQVRAEIRGFGESSDADHITRPNAEGQACAMVRAMESAGLRPDGIGLINAHGTATAANDACESRAIHLAFGEHAGRIIVGASKSFFGHLLGASGVVETIASVLTLERRRMPPNLNLDRADPECPLRLAGPEPAPHDGTALMKNSFGFGGNNAVLVLTRGT